ncbi:lectin-like domain-containing protein, partial [Leuconostoc suionicum]
MKKNFKMYKSGKIWVIAGLSVIALYSPFPNTIIFADDTNVTQTTVTNKQDVDRQTFLKYFTPLGTAASNPYSSTDGIQKLTTDKRQVGIVTFNGNIDLHQKFNINLDVNVGSKDPNYMYAGQYVADGIGFAFYTGEKNQLGYNAGNLGIYGIPNAFGWKIDTYKNTETPSTNGLRGQNDSTFDKAPYGAFITTNSSGYGAIDTNTYKKISDNDNIIDGNYHNLNISYDGNMNITVTLNVNGSNYVFTKNLSGVVDQNAALHFNISSSTGGGLPSKQSVRFNSMNYAKTAAINAKDSTLTAGPNTKWSAEDNFTSATDQDGNSVDFKDVQVEGQVDTTKAGQYPVTYKYTDASGNPVSKTITVTVVDSKAAINAKDSTLTAGPNTKWSAEDNFTSATDQDGNPVDFKDVQVEGQVDTTKAGQYPVTYKYTDASGNPVSKTITVTVVDSKAAINAKDSTLTA